MDSLRTYRDSFEVPSKTPFISTRQSPGCAKCLGHEMLPTLARSHRMPSSFISIVMMALIPTVDGKKL